MQEDRDKLIKPEERLDDLKRSNLMIIQNPGKFCFGMDAVLLSGYARAVSGERGVDLGTGTGIIPILLSAKTQADHFTAIELQEESADMARRSVLYNGLQDKIDVRCMDLREASKQLGSGTYDFVTSNPPYMDDAHGLKNPDEAMAIARHEVMCTLEDVVREASRLLRNGGRFYMVHRPHRLIEIIVKLREHKLEPKRMCMVHPSIGKDANMVLIEAVKGGGVWLKEEPPIIVYDEDGKYTDTIREIYGY